MQHYNSVFHGIQKHIPWGEFSRLVDAYGSDYRTRRLSTKSQFLALLYGQLSGAVSLREITVGLSSHRARLYHVGASAPSRSTLSDANSKRSADLFGDLFSYMVGMAHPKLRRKHREVIRLVDATKLKLSSLTQDWARFSDDLCALKLHTVYDPNADCPVYAIMTPDNVNDITPAKDMPIEPKATYIFDLGYYDFGWWHDLDEQDCRFVTRLKKNSPLYDVKENSADLPRHVLSDRTGILNRRSGYGRHNPYKKPLREVVVRIQTGKVIRLATNDLTSPAEDIADLYKQRWQIELFFKWIKQNLHIKTFIGTSENAIRTQVYVALIAFLLIRMAFESQTSIKKLITFRQVLKTNIMTRKPIGDLLKHEQIRRVDQRQTQWNF